MANVRSKVRMLESGGRASETQTNAESANAIICFVDLKNSTRLLTEKKEGYRAFQERMLKFILSEAPKGHNDKTSFYQFTGDGYIFIRKIEKNDETKACQDILEFMQKFGTHATTGDQENGLTADFLKRIGMRFGLAVGEIEKLPSSDSFDDEFYIGQPLNLAARLEHATRLEFLEYIRHKKMQIEQYTALLSASDKISGTLFEDDLATLDRQVGYIRQATEANFEIRAIKEFKDYLSPELMLGWKTVFLAPKGFTDAVEVNLLYGQSPGEMFTPV